MEKQPIIPPEILKGIVDKRRQQLGKKASEVADTEEQLEIDRMISEGAPLNEKQGENDD